MIQEKSSEIENRIGFIQGRLSDLVNNRIQQFPVKNWKVELKEASRNEIRALEWTIDSETISRYEKTFLCLILAAITAKLKIRNEEIIQKIKVFKIWDLGTKDEKRVKSKGCPSNPSMTRRIFSEEISVSL